MKKISVIDSDKNNYIYYRQESDADLFIEQGLMSEKWGSNGTPSVLIEDMSELQIEAWQFLADTDWYACRKMDSGVEIPEDILTARQQARGLL